MQFFDRPGRSKIALRGSSSRPATSEELLAKAKKAREERARRRQQHHAATTIQRLYRSRAATEALVLNMEGLPTLSLDDALVKIVLCSGLINSRSISVTDNVEKVCKALEYRPYLSSVVERLLEDNVISQALMNSSLLDHCSSAFQLIYVKASALLLAYVARAVRKGRDARLSVLISASKAACAFLNSLPDTTCTDQAEWGIIVHLSNVLRVISQHADLKSSVLPSISSVVMNILARAKRIESKKSEIAEMISKQLALCLLSVEGTVANLELEQHPDISATLIHSLARPSLSLSNQPTSEFAWDVCYSTTTRSLLNVAIMLSNVLDLGEHAWSSEENEVRWPMISVISLLIHTFPKDLWQSTIADDDDVDMDIDTVADLENKDDPGSSSRLDAVMLRSVMTRVSTSLDRIVSKESVSNIFAAAVSEGHEALQCVCNLFNFLTRRDRKLVVPLRDALALWRGPHTTETPHILNSLWQECIFEQNKSHNGASVERVLRPDAGPILSIFSATYAYLLYFQDADEMFDSGWPFSLDEAREIAIILKQQLFSALFIRNSRLSLVTAGDKAAGTSYNNQHILRGEPNLLDEVTRLLSRLHAVDSQRQFTVGDKFWEAGHGALSSESFITDAIEAGPEVLNRAHEETSYGGVRQIKYRSGRQHTVSGAGELLRVAPYLIPFTTRSKIFQNWVAQERDRAMANHMNPLMMAERTVSVHRNNIYEDAFRELNGLGEGLRATIRVKFIDEHGLEEAGIDGGGVFKEFMHEVLRVGFSPYSYALFRATPDGHLYPNPDARVAVENYVTQFEFLGRLLGKAVFDGILVDIPLAKFFRLKMLGEVNYPTDLMSLDPQMYKSIKMLKSYPAETVEDLGLTFTVVNNAFGVANEVELKDNGRNVAVSAKNRIEYIHRLAHYRMNLQIKDESEAFLRGFYEVVPSQFIRLFSHDELQLLISGKGGKIDLEDWRRNTRYSGGYSAETPVIQWFWIAVEELTAEDQAKMLQFVTSSPRAPLLGFAYLVPGFCIHRAQGNVRLPTASTCMNLLKLPEYPSLDIVREKLKYALQSNAGFDLS